MAHLPRTVRSERSNDRMADLIRRSGSLILRRSALKHPLVWHRKAGTGFTASIAKLTESAGTCEREDRARRSIVESDQRLSEPTSPDPSIRIGLGGTGDDR